MKLVIVPSAVAFVGAGRSSRRHRVAGTRRATPLVERVGRHRIHPAEAPASAARRPPEGARVLADAGVDRDRSDHLRPAVALRAAGEARCSKGSWRTRRASRRRRSRRSASTRCSSGPTAAITTKPPRRNSCRHSPPSELRAGRAARARRRRASRRRTRDLPALATDDGGPEGAGRAAGPIFDAAFEPMSPPRRRRPGKDILQASANNVLPGRDARGLEELPGAISAQLARREGRDAAFAKRSTAPARRTARSRRGSTRRISKKAIGVSWRRRAPSRIRRRRRSSRI